MSHSLALCLLVPSADNSFADSVDPDQACRFVRPDLDPSCCDTLMVFLIEFFEKVGKKVDDKKAYTIIK